MPIYALTKPMTIMLTNMGQLRRTNSISINPAAERPGSNVPKASLGRRNKPGRVLKRGQQQQVGGRGAGIRVCAGSRSRAECASHISRCPEPLTSMLAERRTTDNIIVFIETIMDVYRNAQPQSRSAPCFRRSRFSRQLHGSGERTQSFAAGHHPSDPRVGEALRRAVGGAAWQARTSDAS